MKAVYRTQELLRVLRMPRRQWEDEAKRWCEEATKALRRPGHETVVEERTRNEDGTETVILVCGTCGVREYALRPVQCASIREAVEQQGLFGGVGVGQGKTLTTMLIGWALQSQRNILMVPAELLEKTQRSQIKLAQHWFIPRNIRLMSIQWLGTLAAKHELTLFRPDLIQIDEAQMFKNENASRTIRLFKYANARRKIEAARGLWAFGQREPQPVRWKNDEEMHETIAMAGGVDLPYLRVCVHSGSFTNNSINDYHHLEKLALPHASVTPWVWSERERWDKAIGDLPNEAARIAPGALLDFCGEPEEDIIDELQRVRSAYGRRLRETPGHVMTTHSNDCTASILVKEVTPTPDATVEACLDKLRNKWELPDNFQLVDGKEVARNARTLDAGYFIVWDPRPPQSWLDARKACREFVLTTIDKGNHDSMFDVLSHFPDAPEVVLWQQEREKYEYLKKAIWVSNTACEDAAHWLANHKRGICWSNMVDFSERLCHMTRVPFFHNMGLDANGRYIEDYKGPIIASVQSNLVGRNLQFNWDSNYIVNPSASGEKTEQQYGRTHRYQQPSDVVRFDVRAGIREHILAFNKALSRAEYIQSTTFNVQKLMLADIDFPTADDLLRRKGPRWDPNKKQSPKPLITIEVE
jgi:hypothetical protein